MWSEIRLPAIAEEDDPIGRKPAEPLCPERFNIKELLEIRDQIGPQLFDAMYQQNPSTTGTQMFKKDWWKSFEKENLPDFDVIIQSWDCGYIKTANSSYSVCATIGSMKDEYYILEVFRERLEFPELIRAVQNNYARFRPNLILIESEASGISVIQTLYNETHLPIKAIKLRNRTKTERAWEVTHLVESGKVHLPEKAIWLTDFLEEITLFPQSKHSDQVDAFTQGLYFLNNSARRWSRKSSRETMRPSTGREELYPDSKNKHTEGYSLFNGWINNDRRF